jgi:hypothetical protein
MNPANFNYTISWQQDFTEVSKPPANSVRDAFTSATGDPPKGIVFTSDANGKRVLKASKFSVTLTMSKANSWVVTDKESNSLLNHEQGHYNLTALSARDFLNDALALTANTNTELQAAYDALKLSCQSELSAMNKMYDDDPNCGTNHGKDANKQTQWDLRIKNAMNNSTARLSSLASCPATPAASPTP